MCDKDMEELRDHSVTRDEPKLASDVVFFLWISLWYPAYFEDYCLSSHQPDISSDVEIESKSSPTQTLYACAYPHPGMISEMLFSS